MCQVAAAEREQLLAKQGHRSESLQKPSAQSGICLSRPSHPEPLNICAPGRRQQFSSVEERNRALDQELSALQPHGTSESCQV